MSTVLKNVTSKFDYIFIKVFRYYFYFIHKLEFQFFKTIYFNHQDNDIYIYVILNRYIFTENGKYCIILINGKESRSYPNLKSEGNIRVALQINW